MKKLTTVNTTIAGINYEEQYERVDGKINKRLNEVGFHLSSSKLFP
jgi:hypothetical protein